MGVKPGETTRRNWPHPTERTYTTSIPTYRPPEPSYRMRILPRPYCTSTIMGMSRTEANLGRICGQGASDIAASIESGIRDGALRPGEQLPAVRTLANRLGVSPATVGAAYRALQGRGLVTTRGRLGTTVSLGPPVPTRGPMHVPSSVRNLADGNPDPALLPSLGAALTQLDPTPLLYGSAPNLPALLDVAHDLFDADGIPHETLTIVGGAMDAFERLLSAYVNRGDRLAIEDPGHANLIDLAGALGLEIEAVRVDDDGPRPEDLRRALERGARAVAITPRAQNPTGAAVTRDRGLELADLLQRFPDTLVIEDDHSGPLAGAPTHTLVGGLERWAVVRSASKALGPDLRLAIVAGDATTIGRVEGRRLLGTGWVSSVLQRLVASLLSDPQVHRLLAIAADTYGQRRTALLDALAHHGIAAHGRSGLNVWVPVAEENVPSRLLLNAGWAVSPGERFRLSSPPALRVTIATLAPEEATRFADDLNNALQPQHRTYEA